MQDAEKPRGQPALIVMPMPKDTNQSGDVFGGWLMAQMDVAGAVVAWPRAGGRVVTVAADAMVFHRPVFVGNVVSFHVELVRVGRTSLQVRVEAWARRQDGQEERVTTGSFTYVRVGDDRKPMALAQDQ